MSGPLDGCVVSLGGTFPGQTQAQLAKDLKAIGATITPSVTKKTTHVITTDADFGTNAKVRTGQQQGCHIVSLEWVEESKRQGAPADEADFGFDTATTPAVNGKGDSKKDVNGKTNGKKTDAAAAADASQSNGDAQDDDLDTSTARRSGRKRAAPAAKPDPDDDPAPAPKKAKPAATKSKKAKDADPADDDTAAASQNGNTDDKAAPSQNGNTDDKAAPSQNGKTDDKGTSPAKHKPTFADGQILKSKDIVIPVDEGVSLTSPSVYVSPEGVIYDAALNQTNAGKNNNKFYRLQLLKSGGDHKTWTRWGRVGERGQSALLGDGTLADALKQFTKKFKDKSGLQWVDRALPPKPNKYAFVERSYDPDSDDEDSNVSTKAMAKKGDGASEKELVCTLEKPVQDLLRLIFNASYLTAALSDLRYDAEKLPLGKLSRSTILKGFQTLKDLSELLNDPTLGPSKYNKSGAAATEDLSNLFYSLIPHDFGRNRPPVISSSPQLKREIELLDSLSDMKTAAEIMKLDNKFVDERHPLDLKFEALAMNEMTVLDHKDTEFKLLENYLQGSKGDTHHHSYKVQDIFRIERQGEHDRFDQSVFSKVKSDRRLLWHGSRSTNFGGILSQGLRIAPPEAPVNGYMFDKGVYLADMASKSANYCNAYSSGGNALLLLCEAELGDPMLELLYANCNACVIAKSQNAHSTWGKGSTGPSKWMDAGAVHPSLKGVKMPDTSVKPGPTNVPGASLQYNEYIAYDIAQIKLRYLLWVKM